MAEPDDFDELRVHEPPCQAHCMDRVDRHGGV